MAVLPQEDLIRPLTVRVAWPQGDLGTAALGGIVTKALPIMLSSKVVPPTVSSIAKGLLFNLWIAAVEDRLVGRLRDKLDQ